MTNGERYTTRRDRPTSLSDRSRRSASSFVWSEAVAEQEAKGRRVIEAASVSQSKAKRQRDLVFKVADHQGEPCHAVVVEMCRPSFSSALERNCQVGPAGPGERQPRRSVNRPLSGRAYCQLVRPVTALVARAEARTQQERTIAARVRQAEEMAVVRRRSRTAVLVAVFAVVALILVLLAVTG